MSISSASAALSEPEPTQRLRTIAASTVRTLGLILGLAAVSLAAMMSLRFGSLELSTRDAWDALSRYDSTVYEQVIVRTMRLPRTLIALAVGGALAVAGTVMQGVTRNPLADPSILGVSQGASLGLLSLLPTSAPRRQANIFGLHFSAPCSHRCWCSPSGVPGRAARVRSSLPLPVWLLQLC